MKFTLSLLLLATALSSNAAILKSRAPASNSTFIETAKAGMTTGLRASWEHGAATAALIEHDGPNFSPFSKVSEEGLLSKQGEEDPLTVSPSLCAYTELPLRPTSYASPSNGSICGGCSRFVGSSVF